MGNVVQLHPNSPFSEGPPRTGGTGPSRWYQVRPILAAILHRLRCPGFVKPLEIHDPITRDTFTVRCSSMYTVITLNGRDYYFDRLTGKFDGTGYTPGPLGKT